MGNIGLRAMIGYSRNKNVNINADKLYYYENFPKTNITLLEVRLKSVVGLKEAFKKIIRDRGRQDILEHWIESVKCQESEIKTLLDEPPVGAEFASNIESQLMAVEKLQNEGKELVEELKKQDINVYEFIPTPKPFINNMLDHPTSMLIGIQSNIDKTVESLGGMECAVIGIWGACGIGKSTVLREVEKRFHQRNNKLLLLKRIWGAFARLVLWYNESNNETWFSKVILVKDTNTIEGIQNEIARHLELVGGVKQNFNQQDRETRAMTISKALAKHKFLIMLDDVWTEVSFSDIGIPRLEKETGCKIVYSTRSKAICHALRPNKTVVMEPLNPSDSRDLFKAHGKIMCEQDVEKFVSKCAGLPLALITVALGTVESDIEYAYRCLNHSPTEIKGMQENVLEVLKPSFDSLTDAATKKCFLFCVLFQDSKDIDRSTLKDYWIGEELVADVKADHIVEQLSGRWLVEKTRDGTHVKLHNANQLQLVSLNYLARKSFLVVVFWIWHVNP